MKDIKDILNEGLFSSKNAIDKRLNKLGIKDKELEAIGSGAWHAATLFIDAIDYMVENPEEFKDYDLDHIVDAVRDAINNALEESGYDKKLLFLKGK